MLIFLNILWLVAFICWIYFYFKDLQAIKLAKDGMSHCIGMWMSSHLMILIVCIKAIIK